MRRSALLIYTGFALACFSGCHSHWWHRKHHNPAGYAAYEACGCDSTIAAPLEPIPAPLGYTIPTASPYVPTTPTAAAPGAAAVAPAGTKVSTPLKP
jgi:hypothetical protein